LLPAEQFAVGGVDTVRGYRQNLLVFDKGYAASLEYRMPLVRLPVPGWSEEPQDGILYLAPFADIGGGSNNDRPTPDPDTVYSVGSGLRWSPAPGFSLVLYAGVPLKDVPDVEDEGLQDKGIHFELRARLY
jgi:hemolysin activation/secretion protein